MEHIFPIFNTVLSLEDKEKLLNQKPMVVWLVGLSGSGKSTLARGLENALHEKGFLTQLLDGDNLRSGINNNLSFTDEDRIENIRRAAEVSKLFANCGSGDDLFPYQPYTGRYAIWPEPLLVIRYFEVFVNCPD
jgi:adenylylsulfate kinase